MKLISQLRNKKFRAKKGSNLYKDYTDSKTRVWYISEMNENGKLCLSSLSHDEKMKRYDSDKYSGGEFEDEYGTAWHSEEELEEIL